MDKFFSFLGKFFVFAGIAGILIGGGYYLGTRLSKSTSVARPTGIMAQNITPTHLTGSGSSTSVTPSSSPQKGETGRFAVTGGGASGTSFSKYLLSAISGWQLSKTEQSGLDKVALTKGEYQLSILQAALGGGGCTFPGDPPQEMSVTLTNPVAQIPLLDGTLLKRGQADSGNNPGKETFDVCQKGQGNTYGNLTYFGVINYTTPLSPDASILAEMDAMVGSLQKQ